MVVQEPHVQAHHQDFAFCHWHWIWGRSCNCWSSPKCLSKCQANKQFLLLIVAFFYISKCLLWICCKISFLWASWIIRSVPLRKMSSSMVSSSQRSSIHVSQVVDLESLVAILTGLCASRGLDCHPEQSLSKFGVVYLSCISVGQLFHILAVLVTRSCLM